jgi:hypothetical protein
MVGLARNFNFYNESASLDQDQGQLLVQEMYNHGLIEQPIFSFFMPSSLQQHEVSSYVHFGRSERFE